MQPRILKAGETFEQRVAVAAPCAFSFAFSVEDDAALEYTVLLLSAKGKETRLLPLSSHTELRGEVLLPEPGTFIARWHNPSGWLWSSSVTLHYELDVVKPVPPAPAPESRPVHMAEAPSAADVASAAPAVAAPAGAVPVPVSGNPHADDDGEAAEAMDEEEAEMAEASSVEEVALPAEEEAVAVESPTPTRCTTSAASPAGPPSILSSRATFEELMLSTEASYSVPIGGAHTSTLVMPSGGTCHVRAAPAEHARRIGARPVRAGALSHPSHLRACRCGSRRRRVSPPPSRPRSRRAAPRVRQRGAPAPPARCRRRPRRSSCRGPSRYRPRPAPAFTRHPPHHSRLSPFATHASPSPFTPRPRHSRLSPSPLTGGAADGSTGQRQRQALHSRPPRVDVRERPCHPQPYPARTSYQHPAPTCLA